MRTAPLLCLLMLACPAPQTVGEGDGGQASDDLTMPISPNADLAPAFHYSSALSIIVEPSDKGNAFQNALKGATTSIHMTMYLLSDTDTIKTLIAKKAIAKVVLNRNFPDPGTSNSAVYSQLKNAGVDVVWAPTTFTYTHEKCVILDGTTAWIMTMNATNSSPTSNREYLAIDNDPDDVAEAEAIFAADYAGTESTAAEPLVVALTNAQASLAAFLKSAKSSIDVEVETLSDDTLLAVLMSRNDAGVDVRITLSDDPPSTAEKDAINLMKTHGMIVKKLTQPFLHAKAIVVDGAVAWVGSENFTTNSLIHNRELGVYFDTASEVKKVQTQIRADYTAATAF